MIPPRCTRIGGLEKIYPLAPWLRAHAPLLAWCDEIVGPHSTALRYTAICLHLTRCRPQYTRTLFTLVQFHSFLTRTLRLWHPLAMTFFGNNICDASLRFSSSPMSALRCTRGVILQRRTCYRFSLLLATYSPLPLIRKPSVSLLRLLPTPNDAV